MNAMVIGNNAKHAKLFSMFCDNVYLLLQNENSGVYRTSKEMEDYEHIFSDLKYGTSNYWLHRVKEIRKIIKERNVSIIFSNRKDDMICSKIATIGMRNKPILLVTFHNSYAWQEKSKVKVLSKLIDFSTDGVICLSRFVYDALIDNKLQSDKLLFLPNTIQFENFIRKTEYAYGEGDKVRICYTAVISRGKNQGLLIDVVKNLSKYCEIIVTLYGDIIDEDYYQEMKDKIAEYGLERNFVFCGRVDYETVKSKLCENDIYFSTTRLEMSPYNILEAKACALPIMASNVPGQRDLIEDRIDGVLYDLDSVDDASEKLLEIIQSDSMRRTLGENAYIAVSEINSYKVAAEKLQEFVNSIRKIKC